MQVYSAVAALMFFIAGVAAPVPALAAGPSFLTAEESDPRVMGWMQGFPPAEERLITQPDSNYFSFPRLRWSVCYLREFLPTEKGQFIAVFMSFSSHTQNAFYKWRDGTLTPELWRGWELVSMNFFSTPGGQDFWSERSYLFADAFQDYIGLDLMAREPHERPKPWGAFKLGNGAKGE